MRSWRSNCRDDTLTLAKIGSRERIARCQIASCFAVWSSTNMPRSTIRPISSAIEMNSTGDKPANLAQARRLAQRVLCLDAGHVVADLPVQRFFEGPLPEAAARFVEGELP